MNIEIQLMKFLLILFRCSGFFILTPIFGRREFPPQGKIGLAALVSFVVYPLISDLNTYNNVWIIGTHVLKEFTVGISMGYATFLVFTSLYLAGGIIDMEIGFGMVNVLDPQSNTQVPLMGNFFYILTILMFLTIDGHHMLISTIIKSYEILPLGQAVFHSDFLLAVIACFKEMFLLGVKIALPIVSIVFLTNLALGIIARTVPQMNVFIVGLPIKITVGIVGMIMVFPMYFVVMDIIYNGSYENILSFLNGMWVRP
ncbi:MAG: flagellar biosynthetic protein FliR [Tepidanaerobacteraceae bacterium]|nr:flagellar type III secretion system protein FliR [Thermoanaerobacterales bacterium]